MSSEPDLVCEELAVHAAAYVSDALPAADRARVDAHVARCDGCEAYVEQRRFTQRLANATYAFDPRRDDARLVDRFHAWRRSQS